MLGSRCQTVGECTGSDVTGAISDVTGMSRRVTNVGLLILDPWVLHPADTHARWFARPAGLRQPGPLVMQPLSARCMRTCHGIAALQDANPVIAKHNTQRDSPWGPTLVPTVQSACKCLNLKNVSSCAQLYSSMHLTRVR